MLFDRRGRIEKEGSGELVAKGGSEEEQRWEGKGKMSLQHLGQFLCSV